jgi:hypothetical protein
MAEWQKSPSAIELSGDFVEYLAEGVSVCMEFRKSRGSSSLSLPVLGIRLVCVQITAL